jgi:hypothetical protein
MEERSMHSAKGPRWFALAAAFGFTVSAARAEMISPNSIPNPPSPVGSANLTRIFSTSNLVTTQYAGQGLNFDSQNFSLMAITRLNGVTVWAPATLVANPLFVINPHFGVKNPPIGMIDYSGQWGKVSFVLPGTRTPAETSSVTLDIIGRGVSVNFFNSHGTWLGSATPEGSGPYGGQLYTFTSSQINSFTVSAPILDPLPHIPQPNPAWGVAEVSFAPLHAPEPSSFVLAGLGVLGLAARFGWRRPRMAA